MSTPVAVNLRDMIALVASDKLQEEIFALHVPELKINWSMLPADRMRRANRLATELEQFTRDPEFKAKGSSLIRQLNTIAIINADPTTAQALADKISGEVYFKRRLDDPEWLTVPKKGTAILAAFIHVLAFKPIEPSGDQMQDLHNNEAKKKAKEVWNDLVATSASQLKDIKRSAKICVTDPTIPESDRETAYNAFCEEYRRVIKEKLNLDSFYIAVAPMRTQYYTRYLIKTSPLPSEVLMVTPDHKDEKLEDNRMMQAFDILHDEVHGTISISKNTVLPANTVLQMFMRFALGCETASKPKLSYLSSLQPFRGKTGGEAIKIPEANYKLGDRAWISSLSICLNKNLLPTTYRGDETIDVYGQMSAQIDNERFPEKGREVAEMTIKLRLNSTRDGISEDIPTGEDRTFTIKIADRSFRVIGQEKCFDRKHLDLIEKLRHDWGFDGLPIEKEKLSVYDSAQGDLFEGVE